MGLKSAVDQKTTIFKAPPACLWLDICAPSPAQPFHQFFLGCLQIAELELVSKHKLIFCLEKTCVIRSICANIDQD